MKYKVEFKIYSKTTVLIYTALYESLREAMDLIQSYIYNETVDFRLYEIHDDDYDSLLMVAETYRKE